MALPSATAGAPGRLSRASSEVAGRYTTSADPPNRARLETALALAGVGARRRRVAESALRWHLRPRDLAATLRRDLDGAVESVLVNGTSERRLVLLERGAGDHVACSLAGESVGSLPWPVRSPDELVLDEPGEAVSRADLHPDLVHRMSRPEVMIVALYHPEHFPLPRFPLGISDLARAIRSRMIGQVTLFDMQFGLGVEDIRTEIVARSPDILGISATFGQHDVLTALMDEVATLEDGPLVVFGGSLSALNTDVLLTHFPDGFVGHGAGEPTIQDIVAHWHGEIPLNEIRSVAHRDLELPAVRAVPRNLEYTDIVPELDLLDVTLQHKGVMQLESSRGCTHACSFCPRSHKGRWSGYEARLFEHVIGEAAALFDRSPEISRKLFLVDEEFVGSDKNGQALERATSVCDLVHDAGFLWETSTRVDQVYRSDRDRAWHVGRIRFWAHLRDNGLSRCLFGVESGVDSILARFNKHTSGEQNAMAIRLLTALEVPIRCTYITFDQLMTMSELIESYRFQGREDLMLQPVAMEPEELFDAVHDDRFVADARAGRPFYSAISYMLVSMEPLIGSPYLRKVEEAGLAGEWQPSMGRRRADFRDPRIGVMSHAAQCWVDRNFSFDYTLKSLEKITHGHEQAAVRAARVVLKRSAYHLFGRMLAVATRDTSLVARADAAGAEVVRSTGSLTSEATHGLLDTSFRELTADVDRLMTDLEPTLERGRLDVLRREQERWRARDRWELIND